MTSIVATTLQNVGRAHAAIGWEPHARPDFSRLEIRMLPALLLALIQRGVTSREQLCAYLERRSCPFDSGVVAFVLEQFEGDDPELSLWSEERGGRFEPLLLGPTVA